MINVTEANQNQFSSSLRVYKKVDVVVVGAGPAGCVASLSSRRNGADTLLVEKETCLGGLMTGGGIGGIGINGYFAGTEGNPMVVRDISLDIYHRLQAAGGAPPGEMMVRPPTDPMVMMHLLDEMMEEYNVRVLFNTFAFDVVVENNIVKGVAIANKSGGQVILADAVVDASADGDIIAAAGAPFVIGRPKDGRHHGGALDMQIGGIDVNKLIDYLKNQPVLNEAERKELEEDRSRLLGAGRPSNTLLTIEGETVTWEPKAPELDWEKVEKLRKEGGVPRIRLGTGGGGPYPGITMMKDGKYAPLPAGFDREWIDYIKSGKVPPLFGAAEHVYPPPRFGGFNGMGVFRQGQMRDAQMMSGVYECWFDHTDAEEISKAILYMRKLNKVYFNFLRERIPGFENAYIMIEASAVGTREGRRVVGEYTLTEEDLLAGKRFEDVIAMGGPRGPDAHSVTGLWGDGVNSMLEKPYDIPYGCLVPKKIDNLLASGRCISSSHLAFGAIRDQATCMATGEAAGAAAALAVRQGVTVRDLDVRLLQKTLYEQGVALFLDGEEDRKKELGL